MFTLMLLAVLSLMGFSLSRSMRSPLEKMSLAFQVSHKPYQPVKTSKPKGKTKDKFQLLMARAKYSGIGPVALSGKINGTVFLSNNVVRVWKKPNNVRNGFTQFVRGIFSGTSSAWKTLSPSEIATWIAEAPFYFSKRVFGVAYQLKGNTLFQKVNNTLTSLGIANVTSAPTVAVPTFVITNALPAFAQTGQTATVDITEFSGATALPSGAYLKVYATRQVDVGKSSFSLSQYRLIATYDPAEPTNPLDIASDYIARFGALVAGNRIGIAMTSIQVNGSGGEFFESGKFFASAIVGA